MRFDKHGLDATRDAYGVSRRTLYRWKKALREAAGNPAALIPKSSAPKRRRTPKTDPRGVARIRERRTLWPNLGKEIALLPPWCASMGIKPPSASTIGRSIARAPDIEAAYPRLARCARGCVKPMRRPRKTRKPKGLKTAPMQLRATDTIERI